MRIDCPDTYVRGMCRTYGAPDSIRLWVMPREG
jgi:hypothetical protein